jgi:hypothetical protein
MRKQDFENLVETVRGGHTGTCRKFLGRPLPKRLEHLAAAALIVLTLSGCARLMKRIRRSCQNGMTEVCFSLPKVYIQPERCVSRSGETNAQHGRVPETLAPLDA